MVLEKLVQNSKLEFQKLARLEHQPWWLATAEVSAEVATSRLCLSSDRSSLCCHVPLLVPLYCCFVQSNVTVTVTTSTYWDATLLSKQLKTTQASVMQFNVTLKLIWGSTNLKRAPGKAASPLTRYLVRRHRVLGTSKGAHFTIFTRRNEPMSLDILPFSKVLKIWRRRIVTFFRNRNYLWVWPLLNFVTFENLQRGCFVFKTNCVTWPHYLSKF